MLEVRDEMRPDGAAAGRFVLDGGPDGATCARTDAAPDLVLGVAALGAISLGGVDRLRRWPGPGGSTSRRPGALLAADRMFAADRAPYSLHLVLVTSARRIQEGVNPRRAGADTFGMPPVCSARFVAPPAGRRCGHWRRRGRRARRVLAVVTLSSGAGGVTGAAR